MNQNLRMTQEDYFCYTCLRLCDNSSICCICLCVVYLCIYAHAGMCLCVLSLCVLIFVHELMLSICMQS